MTTVQLSCPLCSGILQVDSSMGGRPVTCPHCMGMITIPEFGPEPAPSAPAPASVNSLACPHCTGLFQVLPEMAGQQVACPHCQGHVSVPGDLNSEPPPLTAPAPPTPAPQQQPSAPPSSTLTSQTPPTSVAPTPTSVGPARPIPVKTKESGQVTASDGPKRTVHRGGRKVELRRLTPEEKTQRRRTRNLILSILCLAILLITTAILLR